MIPLDTRSANSPESRAAAAAVLRHDWAEAEIAALFELPFGDLLHHAHAVHAENFDPNRVQLSHLLSIKTGGCPEDCAYCPQSAHYQTGVDKAALMPLDEVVAAAKAAKAGGATRFCMGAAWRALNDRDTDAIVDLIHGVRDLGMETCMTLGMLTAEQAERLAAAGLDYYNHNIDTSESYYGEIISTRTYADRLETLGHVRDAGMKVCCGGIVGMGERRADRVGMLATLANLPAHPESVPINMLIRIEGTPLENAAATDIFEFVRTIAVARIVMPRSMVRLSAGREEMTDEAQALCFYAGANSIFCGPRLLTAANPGRDHDTALFGRLGLKPDSDPSPHG
jgi:biotin synthase